MQFLARVLNALTLTTGGYGYLARVCYPFEPNNFDPEDDQLSLFDPD